MANKPSLSKSRIMSAYQCPKLLYLQKFRPELRIVDAATQARFDHGHDIGALVRSFYPDGYLIQHDDELSLAIEETERLLASNVNITLFEATFTHDNVLIRADILQKVNNSLHVVEVKSSTEIKEYHIIDGAIQYWVIKNAGYAISKIELAYIDSSFIYQGDGNYRGLLQLSSIERDVIAALPQVPSWIDAARKALDSTMPQVSLGAQCFKPFHCDFQHFCWPKTEYPVTLLPRASQKILDLTARGIHDIRNIPDDYLTSETHKKIHRVTLSGKAEIDNTVSKIINELPYPRYYIDFETISFAIPIWKDTRPFQQLPFQWSCHIANNDGLLEHKEFLDTDGDAPMRLFTESLIDAVGNQGPIIVYSSFEKTRLNEMAQRFPNLAPQIQNIISRLFDLLNLIRDYYYHPDMRGSFSIKKVLPTVAPELSYKGMEVGDGMQAQMAYLEMINPVTSVERREFIGNALREYCELDTLAMVKVMEYFGKVGDR